MHGAASAGLEQHYGAKPPKKWRLLTNLGSTQVCFARSLHEILTSSLGSWIHSDCKDLQMLMLNLMFRILNWWSTLLLNEEKLCFLTKPKIIVAIAQLGMFFPKVFVARIGKNANHRFGWRVWVWKEWNLGKICRFTKAYVGCVYMLNFMGGPSNKGATWHICKSW